jgi:hypothetical protein
MMRGNWDLGLGGEADNAERIAEALRSTPSGSWSASCGGPK